MKIVDPVASQRVVNLLILFNIMKNLEKYYPSWMKLKTAAYYSGVGKERLKDLARDGHIKGFQDPDSRRGDWIFDKNSLDQYRENQAGRLYEKAFAIMGRS